MRTELRHGILVGDRPRTQEELEELLRTRWAGCRRRRPRYLVWCGEFPFEVGASPLHDPPLLPPLRAVPDLQIVAPRGTLPHAEAVRRVAARVGRGVCILSWGGGRAARLADAVAGARPESRPLGVACDELARRLLRVHPERGGDDVELYARLLPVLAPLGDSTHEWDVAVAAYLARNFPSHTLLRHVGR